MHHAHPRRQIPCARDPQHLLAAIKREDTPCLPHGLRQFDGEYARATAEVRDVRPVMQSQPRDHSRWIEARESFGRFQPLPACAVEGARLLRHVSPFLICSDGDRLLIVAKALPVYTTGEFSHTAADQPGIRITTNREGCVHWPARCATRFHPARRSMEQVQYAPCRARTSWARSTSDANGEGNRCHWGCLWKKFRN